MLANCVWCARIEHVYRIICYTFVYDLCVIKLLMHQCSKFVQNYIVIILEWCITYSDRTDECWN